MGGRGSSSGAGGATTSKKIKDEFLQKGLSSKFKGVRRDAENGTGRFSFKDAIPIGEDKAKKMQVYNLQERDGKILADGLIGNKKVVFGAKSDNKFAQSMKKEFDKRREKPEAQHVEINTTTTYDRWSKRNKKNFDSWFNGGK